MGSTSLPRFTGQLLAAAGTVGPEPFRLLITGQTGAAGTAADGATTKDVESLTNTEIETLFGVNSDMTNRIFKARAKALGRFSIWAISKDAAAGTAASAALAYAGVATEARNMVVRPISQKQFSFTIPVAINDTANDVAVAVKAKIDALASNFPATNVLAVDTLTLTAADVGTIGNKYTVEHIDIPAGITVNTNEGTDKVQFTSGATDPTLTGLFDNVAGTRFHTIQYPWESDFSEVQNFLEPRNVINNSFLHGVTFIGFDGTEAEISAKVNGGTPLNSHNLFFMGNRTVSGAAAFLEPPDWRAAEIAAIEGLRFTDGVPIGQFITTSAPLDSIGGPGSASLGYYNTPLAETSPADIDVLFDETEQQNLAADGYTIIGVNPASTSTIMGEVISTYKLNDLGNPDTSFKYLNYIRTSYLAFEIFFRTLKTDYSQSRLTNGDLVPGRLIANADSIKANYAKIYKTLSGPDFTLTQAGADAESYFFQNLDLTTDLSTGSVTSTNPLPIVTQIRDFIVTMQISFTVGG
jgi:hypothetical protein